jgi:hypothetical protein
MVAVEAMPRGLIVHHQKVEDQLQMARQIALRK